MEFKVCDKQNFDIAQAEIGDLINQAIPTGITFIDDQAHGILRGRITLFCSPTGHGKSTALMALAKRMAEKGENVLYITIEQELNEMMVRLGKPYDHIVITRMTCKDVEKQWQEIKNVVKELHISVICYDYVGATGVSDNAVADLVNEMNSLSDYAIDTKCAIITACQANPEIFEVIYPSNKNKETNITLLFTNKYIAFSKHLADKIALGFYLIKDKDDKNFVKVYCFKNRCFEHKCIAHNKVFLDYQRVEFNDCTEFLEELAKRNGNY